VQGDPVSANNGVFFLVADHLGSASLTLDASGSKIGDGCFLTRPASRWA
jgi:hypothetical protein